MAKRQKRLKLDQVSQCLHVDRLSGLLNKSLGAWRFDLIPIPIQILEVYVLLILSDNWNEFKTTAVKYQTITLLDK